MSPYHLFLVAQSRGIEITFRNLLAICGDMRLAACTRLMYRNSIGGF